MPARRSEYTALANGVSMHGVDGSAAQHLVVTIEDGGLDRSDGALREAEADGDSSAGIGLQDRLRPRMAVADLHDLLEAPGRRGGRKPVGCRDDAGHPI